VNDVVIKTNDSSILADARVSGQVSADWFSPGWWRSQDAVKRQMGGRGQALLVDTPVGSLVLRRFQRGGLAAQLSRDRYLNLGSERSRAFEEFRVLSTLKQLGLPVPTPVAAIHEPTGPFYRAGLLTRLIPEARELAELAPGLSSRQWLDLAATLKQFFAAGLHHPDLNARNLLLDAQGCWHLLDFDKAQLRDKKVDSQVMRKRLERSLEKLCAPGWRPGFEASLGADF